MASLTAKKVSNLVTNITNIYSDSIAHHTIQNKAEVKYYRLGRSSIAEYFRIEYLYEYNARM